MRKIVLTLLVLLLIIIIIIPSSAIACAGTTTPTSTGAAPTVTVTKTVTATPAPATTKAAKVYRWEPACELATGGPWDALNWWSNIVNDLSDGRIVSTPSTPGAVCPVEEQIETAAAGTTGVMMPTPAYYPGKVPAAGAMINPIPKSSMEMMYAYEYWHDGDISKIYTKALEDRWNVKVFGWNYVSSTLSCP